MGAEYKVHTKLLTEFETLGVMGENNSGIIMVYILHLSMAIFSDYSSLETLNAEVFLTAYL